MVSWTWARSNAVGIHPKRCSLSVKTTTTRLSACVQKNVRDPTRTPRRQSLPSWTRPGTRPWTRRSRHDDVQAGRDSTLQRDQEHRGYWHWDIKFNGLWVYKPQEPWSLLPKKMTWKAGYIITLTIIWNDIEVIDGQIDGAYEPRRVYPEQSVNDEFHLWHSVEAEQLPGVGHHLKDAQENSSANAVWVVRHQRPRRPNQFFVLDGQLEVGVAVISEPYLVLWCVAVFYKGKKTEQEVWKRSEPEQQVLVVTSLQQTVKMNWDGPWAGGRCSRWWCRPWRWSYDLCIEESMIVERVGGPLRHPISGEELRLSVFSASTASPQPTPPKTLSPSITIASRRFYRQMR